MDYSMLRRRLLLALGLLMMADATTTIIGLRMGYEEGNPMAAMILAAIPAPLALPALKLGAMGAIYAFQKPLPGKWAACILTVAVLAMCGVLTWNLMVIT